MTGSGIPPAVEAFLHDRVESIEHLEIVVLLHGAPDRVFSPEEIARKVSVPEAIREAALASLVDKGLAVREGGGYRAAGGTAESAWLASSYSEHAVAVVRLMCSQAIDRVRSSAARTFADAFVLGRKPKKKGDEDA
jgi:hypothetical protein